MVQSSLAAGFRWLLPEIIFRTLNTLETCWNHQPDLLLVVKFPLRTNPMKNAAKWQAISKRIPWDFIPEDLSVSENLDKTWQNPNLAVCIGKMGSLEISKKVKIIYILEKHDSILVVEIWGKWWCSGPMKTAGHRFLMKRESHDRHIGEPFLPHRLLQSHGGFFGSRLRWWAKWYRVYRVCRMFMDNFWLLVCM